MLPSILIYVVGITVHLLISDLSFGMVTLKTSVQALYDTISLPSLNLFQLQIVLAVVGLLTLISVNAFTYFLSAKLEEYRYYLYIAFSPLGSVVYFCGSRH
jgi:hypothetical protein